MALPRRVLLRVVTGLGVGLAGCSGFEGNGAGDTATPTDTATETPTPDPARYELRTPLNVIGVNVRRDTYTVTIRLERRTESTDEFVEVRNRDYEFHPDDTTRIGEFEAPGTYRLTAEIDGEQYEETAAVPMRDLADCNYPTLEVHLHDAAVTIGYSRTDAGYPPATVTPTTDET